MNALSRKNVRYLNKFNLPLTVFDLVVMRSAKVAAEIPNNDAAKS